MTDKSTIQAELEKKALIQSESVYQGRIISVQVDTLSIASGTPKKSELVLHPGAVVIIPITEKGELILIRQWRRAIRQIIIELPAGTLEKNEDPLECAQRELREETGFMSHRITPFGGLYSAPGFCNEYLHLFIAEELVESPLEPDDTEAIDIQLFDLETVLNMIDKGLICDAKTVAGVLRYARWKQLR